MTITFSDERTGLDLASYLGVGLTHGTWPWTLAANLCMAALVIPLYNGAWRAHVDRLVAHALEAVDLAGSEPDVVCTGCHNFIDSTVCRCGEPMDGHSMDDGHTPVPSGCDCLREP